MSKELQLANTLLKTNPEQAEKILEKYKSNRDAQHMMSICKIKLNKWAEAKILLEKLVSKEQRLDDYYFLSAAYTNLNEHENAINILYKAISKHPNNFSLKSHIASKLWIARRYTEGINILLSYPNQTTEQWDALTNYAINMGELDIAENAIHNSLKVNPNNALAHVSLSSLHFLKGNFRDGLKEQEWRLSQFSEYNNYFARYPRECLWKGQNLDGKTILIYGEQGIGDNIQYYRFVNNFKNVIFNCPSSLNALFKGQNNADIISANMTEDIPLPEYDYHTLSFSAPYLLDLDYISGKPYIKATKNKLAREMKSNKLKVGIVWAGNKDYKRDKDRSIPFSFFKFNNPNIQLFSLQMPAQDNESYVNIAKNIQDFSDTADALSGLDLLISCDTSIIHLSGAMGIPTWLCVSYAADARWGLGEKTMWYDSVRIFRQKKIDDWDSVFIEVTKELTSQIPEY